MLRTIFLTITLASLIPLPSFSEEVIIKEGETLSGISSKYKVSLTKIKLINGINDANKVKAGDKIRIPAIDSDNSYTNSTTHKVVRGETISSIAKKYGINKKEIINLNSIKSADYLYLGQVLKLPSNQIVNSKKIANLRKDYHVVKQGETLSNIALNHNTTTEELITINGLNSPNDLTIGSEIKLTSKIPNHLQRESKSLNNKSDNDKWKNYGPLQINWSKWQFIDGSHVAPTLHENGSSIYLAVNCPLRRLNATGTNGVWKDWIYPVDKFEHKLINDLCYSKKG